MDGEYPDPGRPKAFPSYGGPYFVPGLDPFANVDIEDEEDVLSEEDVSPAEDHSPSGDESTEEIDLSDLEPAEIPLPPDPADYDADFDPNAFDVVAEHDDDDLLSESDLEVNSFQSASRGNARGRGRGSRGRGQGRARGSRGMTRALRAFSVDDQDVDEDLFGARKRAPRRAPRGEGRGAGRRGKRGPLVATAAREFRILQVKAVDAFVEGRYEDCAEHCIEAIRENPEIFEAHSLLSQAYLELGRREDSLETLWIGALTRRDALAWKEVAKRVVDVVEDEKDRDLRLTQVYSNIVRIDRDDHVARILRLEIFERQGNKNSVVKECRRVLISRPNDLQILRMLAEASLAIGLASSARPAFEAAIPYYERMQAQDDPDGFSFDHLDLYLDILRALQDWQSGISRGKKLARWLLGRREDTIWDRFPDDDREWDDEDEPRRTEVSGFVSGKYTLDQYGQGVPADLRVKFGLFRLNLGANHIQEALRHFEPFDFNNLPSDSISDFADLIREVADALHDHGYHADCLRFYKCFGGWDGADGISWRRAGISAQIVGDTDNALKYFQLCLDHNPKDTEIRLKVAALLQRARNTEEALHHLKEVIRRETYWTLRSKPVNDTDSSTLVQLIKTRMDTFVTRRDIDDQEAQPTAEQAEDTIIQGESAIPRFPRLPADLDPRQCLSRMFNRILWRPRPRTSVDNVSMPRIPREGAPTPEFLLPHGDHSEVLEAAEFSPSKMRQDRLAKHRKILESLDETEAHVENLYEQLQDIESRAKRDGSSTPTKWTEVGQQLCNEFLEQRFITSAKNVAFAGLSVQDESRVRLSFPFNRDFLTAVCARLMHDVKDEAIDANTQSYLEDIPMTFASIPFPTWLRIILQTCLNLAHHYADETCFAYLDKASKCTVFYHHRPSAIQMQLAQIACATALQDNMRQNEAMRRIVNEVGPLPDVFKLQQLVNRAHSGPVHAYSTGPQHKYISRLVKAQDTLAMSREQRKQLPVSLQSLRGILKTGAALRTAAPDETDVDALDPMLLVLQGNMVTANDSHYINAINYYMRALATQPDNPLALLSASIAYAHMAMKRLSVNRNHQIMTAVAALMRYKEVRMMGADGGEMAEGRLKRQRRMETEYNEARLWHLLGLMHLAAPCYERVLEVGDAGGDVHVGEDGEDDSVLWDEPDFKPEAALALQSIYVHSGDVEGARRLGEKYLVF